MIFYFPLHSIYYFCVAYTDLRVYDKSESKLGKLDRYDGFPALKVFLTIVVARAAVIKSAPNQASIAGRHIPTTAAPSTHSGNAEVPRSHLMMRVVK